MWRHNANILINNILRSIEIHVGSSWTEGLFISKGVKVCFCQLGKNSNLRRITVVHITVSWKIWNVLVYPSNLDSSFELSVRGIILTKKCSHGFISEFLRILLNLVEISSIFPPSIHIWQVPVHYCKSRIKGNFLDLELANAKWMKILSSTLLKMLVMATGKLKLKLPRGILRTKMC